ncbi:hypothetical protein VWQ21_22650, partial [Xanthomonas citri pv. citri]
LLTPASIVNSQEDMFDWCMKSYPTKIDWCKQQYTGRSRQTEARSSELTVRIPGWGTEKVDREVDASINFNGRSVPVRLLCVKSLFVYVQFGGLYYGLNGMAQRNGTTISTGGTDIPVLDEPPLALRMTTNLIPICNP